MLKTFAYHKPSDEGLRRSNILRTAFSDLHEMIVNFAPESRERSIALTELETAAMWAIKAVVVNDKGSKVGG